MERNTERFLPSTAQFIVNSSSSSSSSSFLGSTAQLRLWPPPQNPAEFLGGFSTIFFFTG
jgi:hypothetical protein